MEIMLRFLIFSVTLSTISFTPTFGTGNSSETKLLLGKTTLYGGYLTKSFPVENGECTEIFEPWAGAYNHWSLKLVGKCIMLFKSNNCKGVSRVLTNEKLSFQGYMKKLYVHSIQQCNDEFLARRAPNKPFVFPLLSDRRFSNHVERHTYTGRQPVRKPLFPTVTKPLRLAAPKRNSPVTFYSQPYFRGRRYTSNVNRRCSELPIYYHLKVSSLQNPKDCVRLYEESNCRGRSVQILRDDAYRYNLAALDFDNVARSFGTCEDFQELGLELHNYYRQLHHSPALQMRESLNNVAQLMAEFLATQPSLPRPIGFISAELFYATNNGPEDTLALVREAVDSWYLEESMYDWDNPVSSRFTQLVWKNTRYFGMGTARVGNRSVVVANYFPRGNYAGEFGENVLRSTIISDRSVRTSSF